MGHGAKIALVALLVLMVVAVAKFVQNHGDDIGEPSQRSAPVHASLVGARGNLSLAERPPQEAPRPILMRFGPDELQEEATTTYLACEGLEITGMAGIVRDGNTVEVLVSLKKLGNNRRP